MMKKSKQRLKKHRLALKELAKVNTKYKRRKEILQKGGKDLTSCICECVLNLIKGNVPLTRKQFLRLKAHRQSLESLINKRVAAKKKYKIIQQKGGRLFPLLFTPIIKALAGSVL